MKPIDIVTELRKKHAAEGIKGAGINVKKGMVSDMYELNVLQPLLVSTSAIHLGMYCSHSSICLDLHVFLLLSHKLLFFLFPSNRSQL